VSDHSHRLHDIRKAVTDFTVAELLGGLKPNQLYSLLRALAALVAEAFALGSRLFGG
jgi:hypothetical protein